MCSDYTCIKLALQKSRVLFTLIRVTYTRSRGNKLVDFCGKPIYWFNVPVVHGMYIWLNF